ncbi:MAG: helix-turn-helix transcriptional regulator [Flavobacteriales bacterium]|nr:helix-turn-helix transcriptional regulator [Flavobacteriales bacterium]
MLKFILTLLVFNIGIDSFSQYSFSGEVSVNYYNSKAYLVVVDDYKKSDLLLVENIVSESSIDSKGKFTFSGNCLSPFNKFYNIYIDNCNDNINDSRHLLNKCDSYISKLFLAKNSDTLYFPLNDLDQMLCEIQISTTSSKNNLSKIDSLQESLLSKLHLTKNDAQRNRIYGNYFTELKQFSQTCNDPLIELFAYSLYSGDKSFSRNHYLNDLKESSYFGELLSRLESLYPASPYTMQFRTDLKQDNYFKVARGTSIYKSLTYLFGGLLVIASIYILSSRKKKKTKEENIDYKDVLTAQKLKVFELINQKMTNKEIADQLFVSLSTIKTHINRIYNKLSIKSRNEIHSFF